MRRLAVFALASGVVAGCDNPITYSGVNMDEYFPFDGERTWEFVSTDSSLPYKLVATLDSEFELTNDDATRIYDLTYETVCVAVLDDCLEEGQRDFVRTVRWSSDRTYGTLIYGFETSAGEIVYDPPILVTEGQQLVGDAVETTTGGKTWISTFIAIEHCPVVWTSEWGDKCVHIHLDDGDGQDTSGEYLAGNYWAITQYNVVAMQLTDDAGQWQLSYATYDY